MIPLLLLFALQQTPAPLAVRELAIEPVPHHLAVAALGADGGNRLVSVSGRTLRLVEEPDLRLALAGDSVLWTIADLDRDGRSEFLLLVDGMELRAVERIIATAGGADRLVLSAPILSALKALPPRGVHPSTFAQDLDGDGWADLLLPLGGRVRVLLGGAEGFRPGPDLGALARLKLNPGTGENLLGRVERSLAIPGLQPEDVTGDGRLDLVVSEGLLVRQFVATANGLPEQPTRTVDLTPYRMDPKALELDLSNITQLIRTLVVDEWQDLNGDRIEDLIVLGDGRVHTFLGTASGVDASKPVQSLKLTGNPFYNAAVRMDDDAFADLVVVRVEDIGLGKLLRAALFSWKIEFDFLVYQGVGNGTFAKRPLYDRKVVLEGGSLLSLAGTERERMADVRRTVVRRGDLDGDGNDNDLITLDPAGVLRVWRNAVPAGSPGGAARQQFLRSALGDGRKEQRWEVDDLTQWVMGRTSALIALTRARAADIEYTLEGGWETPHALALRDLDGDGRDEAIVLRRQKPENAPGRLVGFAVSF